MARSHRSYTDTLLRKPPRSLQRRARQDRQVAIQTQRATVRRAATGITPEACALAACAPAAPAARPPHPCAAASSARRYKQAHANETVVLGKPGKARARAYVRRMSKADSVPCVSTGTAQVWIVSARSNPCSATCGLLGESSSGVGSQESSQGERVRSGRKKQRVRTEAVELSTPSACSPRTSYH